MREEYAISELCDALGVSRSGYHSARVRPPARRHEENRRLLAHMLPVHAHRHTRAYGSPRMTDELRSAGLSCSENRVARIMRANNLRAGRRKPFKPRTTTTDHAATPSPNLLKDAAPPNAPGQQLVSDITYIPTRHGWLYLAVVIDLFSRAVLGWQLRDSLHASLVTGAISKALRGGRAAPGAIFHSDRGCQYTARSTRSLLALHGLRQSMSAAGCCYDNAFAESFFATLKAELPGGCKPFDDHQEARAAIFDYLEIFYNRRRRHGSLGNLPPAEFLKNHFLTRPTALN